MKNKCSFCGEPNKVVNKKLNERRKYLKYCFCTRCDFDLLRQLDRCCDVMDQKNDFSGDKKPVGENIIKSKFGVDIK